METYDGGMEHNDIFNGHSVIIFFQCFFLTESMDYQQSINESDIPFI